MNPGLVLDNSAFVDRLPGPGEGGGLLKAHHSEMLPYPEIDPVAVALGPVKIHWYGLTYLVGLAFAWWLAARRSTRPWSPLRTNR